MKRGYFGIVFYEPKFHKNIGTAIRSAHCFGVNFIGIIGKRYTREPSDTMISERHIPIYHYINLKDFMNHLPMGCEVIGVEVDGEDIKNFIHPRRVVYLFGGEDRTLPAEIKNRIKIDTSHCLNMAVAASIVLYDRSIK